MYYYQCRLRDILCPYLHGRGPSSDRPPHEEKLGARSFSSGPGEEILNRGKRLSLNNFRLVFAAGLLLLMRVNLRARRAKGWDHLGSWNDRSDYPPKAVCDWALPGPRLRTDKRAGVVSWAGRKENRLVRFSYGQFSKFHVCFCGLDPGNLKFETVRTNKQHICF